MDTTEAVSTAYEALINVSGVDFNIVLNEMISLLPAILPVVLTYIGFRKGLNFLLGMLRGA